MSLPAWLLTLLGVGAAASAANSIAKGGLPAGVDPITGSAPGDEIGSGLIQPGQEGRGQKYFRDLVKPEPGDTRSFRERLLPKSMGGKDAPATTGSTSGGQYSGDPAPEAAGKYRPEYKLTDADRSQRLYDTIASEARLKSPGGADAVINNMLNRVGSKGWGPSGNLLEVSQASGQYEGAWKGRKATAAESEYIRSRIEAIASGGVPDNTNGSNSFRASWYRGPWYQKFGVNGKDVGGNTFAYDRGTPNGPYAPYAPGSTGKSAPSMTIDPNVGARLQRGLEGLNNAPVSAWEANPFRSTPLGSWSNSSVSTQNNITVGPTTTTVSGVGDAKQAAEVIEKTQTRVHADLLRNLQGAVA